jgi:hypothetical protein
MGQPTSSSESGEESDEEEESGQDVSKPFKGSRPSGSCAHSLFSEDDDDNDSSADFIVEDDSQNVAAQLPSEFSMRSHDNLSHQFKIIFQFFVHVTVRPTVDRHAFMEDQLKSMTLLRHSMCCYLDQNSTGILLFSTKSYSQKIVGAPRFIGCFFRLAAEVQEGA